MVTLNLGIDDAGRGPVIGPMILTGCVLTSEAEKELKKLGVKDSKQLTPKRREFLADEIRKQATSFDIQITSADEIDKSQEEKIKLNELEALKVANIINKLNNGEQDLRVVVDCPSVSIVKWEAYLKEHIKNLSTLIISCEHKADQKHVSVSAASILAKSEREKQMDILKKEYGPEIGSGYTSDTLTQKFVKKYAEKYANKGIFRKCWETYQNAIKDKAQMKLA
jgi:ribonuclease HII